MLHVHDEAEGFGAALERAPIGGAERDDPNGVQGARGLLVAGGGHGVAIMDQLDADLTVAVRLRALCSELDPVAAAGGRA